MCALVQCGVRPLDSGLEPQQTKKKTCSRDVKIRDRTLQIDIPQDDGVESTSY